MARNSLSKSAGKEEEREERRKRRRNQTGRGGKSTNSLHAHVYSEHVSLNFYHLEQTSQFLFLLLLLEFKEYIHVHCCLNLSQLIKESGRCRGRDGTKCCISQYECGAVVNVYM